MHPLYLGTAATAVVAPLHAASRDGPADGVSATADSAAPGARALRVRANNSGQARTHARALGSDSKHHARKAPAGVIGDSIRSRRTITGGASRVVFADRSRGPASAQLAPIPAFCITFRHFTTSARKYFAVVRYTDLASDRFKNFWRHCSRRMSSPPAPRLDRRERQGTNFALFLEYQPAPSDAIAIQTLRNSA